MRIVNPVAGISEAFVPAEPRPRETPKPWTFESGLKVLEGSGQREDRTLDAMSLLANFYGDREDELIPLFSRQLVDGDTPTIRREAALSLGLMLNPESKAAIREAIHELDSETRHEAEEVLRATSGQIVSTLGHAKGLQGEELRVWLNGRMVKLGGRARDRAEKLAERLRRDEFRDTSLEVEPAITPDLAVGGVGYRMDFVPSNPQSATFSVWIGIQGIRCSIGERGAAFTRKVGNRIGWGFWSVGLRSYADSVRGGRAIEHLAPESNESLVELPLAGNEIEEFRTSSLVPRLDALPANWSKVEYAAYGS